MLKFIRKFRWVFILLGLLLMLFVLGKLMVAHTNNKVTQCVADFQDFEPSPRTAVMRLYGTLYFPNYKLTTEELAGEYISLGFTVKKDKIFWAYFEKNDTTKKFSQRFVVYQSDVDGENATEVFSMEGTFYNASYTHGTRDAFLFSYCMEKNETETKQILKYDINTNSVSLVSMGKEYLLGDAVAEQEKTEIEKDLWKVEEQEDTFKIIRREDGTMITTIERDFWKGTLYETAFADKPVWKVTTNTWNDTVIFSVWIAYGFMQSYVTVSFAYDPQTEQLEFLSCVEPYEYEWFDIILLE